MSEHHVRPECAFCFHLIDEGPEAEPYERREVEGGAILYAHARCVPSVNDQVSSLSPPGTESSKPQLSDYLQLQPGMPGDDPLLSAMLERLAGPTRRARWAGRASAVIAVAGAAAALVPSAGLLGAALPLVSPAMWVGVGLSVFALGFMGWAHWRSGPASVGGDVVVDDQDQATRSTFGQGSF